MTQQAHFVEDYTKYVRALAAQNPNNTDLVMALAIGSPTIEAFRTQGDQQVHILKRFGLANGQSIYDLGCGSGRTATALQRSGWQGTYKGADIIPDLIGYLRAACPGYEAIEHKDVSIAAADASLDIVFGWSIFTHLFPEETYLYLQDIHRALKPGAKLVFSFLEFAIPPHWTVFETNVDKRRRDVHAPLDAFLHRDVVALWAARLGFAAPVFLNGDDPSTTPQGLFGQSVAVLGRA